MNSKENSTPQNMIPVPYPMQMTSISYTASIMYVLLTVWDNRLTCLLILTAMLCQFDQLPNAL